MATASRQIDADDASATQALRSLQDLIETQAMSLRRMRRQAKRDQNSAASRGSRERRSDEDASQATQSDQGLVKADEIGARLSEWMRSVATSCVAGCPGFHTRRCQSQLLTANFQPLPSQPAPLDDRHPLGTPRQVICQTPRPGQRPHRRLESLRLCHFQDAKVSMGVFLWCLSIFSVFGVTFGPRCPPHLSSSAPLARNTSKMKALNTDIGIHLDGVRAFLCLHSYVLYFPSPLSAQRLNHPF